MYKLELSFIFNDLIDDPKAKRELNIFITKNNNKILKYNILGYNYIMNNELYNSIDSFLNEDNDLIFYYKSGDSFIKFKNNKIKFVLYDYYNPIYLQTQYILSDDELFQFKKEFKDKLKIYNF